MSINFINELKIVASYAKDLGISKTELLDMINLASKFRNKIGDNEKETEILLAQINI